MQLVLTVLPDHQEKKVSKVHQALVAELDHLVEMAHLEQRVIEALLESMELKVQLGFPVQMVLQAPLV